MLIRRSLLKQKVTEEGLKREKVANLRVRGGAWTGRNHRGHFLGADVSD
jgi:hypothetical protein